MARLCERFLLIWLLILPSVIFFAGNGGGPTFVNGQIDNDDGGGDQGDMMEGEDDEDDDDVTVEADDGAAADTDAEPDGGAVVDADTEDDEDADEEPQLKPSENADTFILFTKPKIATELPAGGIVRILVGFTNKGDSEFMVENMEASFRYPQDYSFYIQNFTAMKYNQIVEPNHQATFEYAFSPNEAFHSRPFGLTINLNYKDAEENIFQSAVFNETINVVEPDEGLDGETFFLYIFLAAVFVLLLVGAQQLLSTFKIGRKLKLKPSGGAPVEMGTQNTDIDYDWIPKENLIINKSPKSSPKQSPRQRRSKRGAAVEEE